MQSKYDKHRYVQIISNANADRNTNRNTIQIRIELLNNEHTVVCANRTAKTVTRIVANFSPLLSHFSPNIQDANWASLNKLCYSKAVANFYLATNNESRKGTST